MYGLLIIFSLASFIFHPGSFGLSSFLQLFTADSRVACRTYRYLNSIIFNLFLPRCAYNVESILVRLRHLRLVLLDFQSIFLVCLNKRWLLELILCPIRGFLIYRDSRRPLLFIGVFIRVDQVSSHLHGFLGCQIIYISSVL